MDAHVGVGSRRFLSWAQAPAQPAIEIMPGGSPVSVAYRCSGCGHLRTFTAPTLVMVGWQIASAGWKVDGARAECPSCWMAFERSVVHAAEGTF